MARQIFINIDTTLNQVQITDVDSAAGDTFLDYHGKVGQPITMERENTLALTNLSARVKLTTILGSTMMFAFADIDDVQIDGVTIGAADLSDVLTGIGAYLFTSIGGGCTGVAMFEFGVGKQDKSMTRINWVGELSDVSLNNVSSYTIYKNGTLIPQPIAFPVSITQDDRIYVSVVRTAPASAASVDFLVDGVSGLLKYPALDYFHPRTTLYTENVTIVSDYALKTDQSFRGNGTTAANYYTNLIYDTPVKGSWEMIIPPDQPVHFRAFYGMNDRTRSDTWPQREARSQYQIARIGNDIWIQEFSNIRATLTLTNPNQIYFKIKGTAGTVTYYYSNDNQATWTLIYTSLVSYNVNTNFYQEQDHYYGDTLRSNYGIFNPCRMVQL